MIYAMPPLTVVGWNCREFGAGGGHCYFMIVEFNQSASFRRANSMHDILYELPKEMQDWARLHTALRFGDSITENNLCMSFVSRFDRDRFAARWLE